MPSNKGRLYIALYVRGGQPKMPGLEDKWLPFFALGTRKQLYHWALLAGATNENGNQNGIRYHAKNAPGQTTWVFEERPTSMTATNMILVRVLIGKILDPNGLATKLRSVKVENDDPTWNCVLWVKNALDDIASAKDLMRTSKLDWKVVKDAAMAYCQRKTEQGRFNGSANFDSTRVPTFDLLEGRESVR